jgi:hypothetical protein
MEIFGCGADKLLNGCSSSLFLKSAFEAAERLSSFLRLATDLLSSPLRMMGGFMRLGTIAGGASSSSSFQ